MELKIIAHISGGTRSNNLYFFAHVYPYISATFKGFRPCIYFIYFNLYLQHTISLTL